MSSRTTWLLELFSCAGHFVLGPRRIVAAGQRFQGRRLDLADTGLAFLLVA
jgi:hypothetical protein